MLVVHDVEFDAVRIEILALILLLGSLFDLAVFHVTAACKPRRHTFVFVGILGGFTTFSSFMLDTFTLGHGGEHAIAFWNVALQTALGLLAVWAGFRIGHSICKKRAI